MCLLLAKEPTKRRRLRKENGAYVGWKCVNTGDGVVESPIFNFFWETGYNRSSRDKGGFTSTEKKRKEAYKGFHIFLSLVDAREYGAFHVMKVSVSPKDLVGVGTTELRSKVGNPSRYLHTMVARGCHWDGNVRKSKP